MVLTQIVLLLSLCYCDQELCIMLIPKTLFGLLEELNSILNALVLSTACNRDNGVFDRIQFEIQPQNHFTVHNNKLIAIFTCIESNVFHIVHEQVCQLMPHLADPECLQLCNLVRQLWELDLVLIENGMNSVVGDCCH